MTASNHTCPKEYHKQSVPETRKSCSSRLHWQSSWGIGVNEGLD